MSLTLQIQGLDHSDFTVLHTEFARPVLAKLQSPFAFLSKAIKISSQVLITETLRIIVVDCWLVVFFFFKNTNSGSLHNIYILPTCQSGADL